MQEERTNVPKIRFKGYAEDWEQRKFFESIASTIDFRGRTPKKLGMDWSDSGYLALSALNVKNGYIDPLADAHYGDEKLYRKWMSGRELKKGQVLFTTEAPMGNVAQVPDDNGYILSQRTVAFETKEDMMTNDFLAVLLKSPLVFNNLSALSSGGTAKGVSQKSLKGLSITVPLDIDEQQKISSFFKQLDNTIALHQRGLDLLKQTKKSYLQKMFPKKGEDKPEIRFAGFTDAWEQRKLGEMVKQFSIKSKKEDEYTVLSSTNSGMEIRDGRVSGTSNLGYKIVEDGDLVLSPQNLWLGNININDIGKGLVSPSYKTFKFTNINSAFLKPQLHTSKMLEEYKNSSTQGASIVRRNLELDSFYQIPMLVPTTEEQSKLGVFFESMDNTITLHQRELDSLKEMKKSLLQQMFV